MHLLSFGDEVVPWKSMLTLHLKNWLFLLFFLLVDECLDPHVTDGRNCTEYEVHASLLFCWLPHMFPHKDSKSLGDRQLLDSDDMK